MSGTVGSPIINGALVHQRWGDLEDGTLIAVVDYLGTGVALAKECARKPSSSSSSQSWVVTCCSSGKQFYFTPEKVAEMDAKDASR